MSSEELLLSNSMLGQLSMESSSEIFSPWASFEFVITPDVLAFDGDPIGPLKEVEFMEFCRYDSTPKNSCRSVIWSVVHSVIVVYWRGTLASENPWEILGWPLTGL